jgi:hypothetical protein
VFYVASVSNRCTYWNLLKEVNLSLSKNWTFSMSSYVASAVGWGNSCCLKWSGLKAEIAVIKPLYYLLNNKYYPYPCNLPLLTLLTKSISASTFPTACLTNIL